MSFPNRNLMEIPEIQTPGRPRSGGHVLALLAVPLNGLILRVLDKRPMRLAELRGELGGPAQTTLRGHLRSLAEVGAVLKCGGGMPYAVENELTEAGRELLEVTEILAGWLARAPEGPITLGSVGAKGTIKALAGGWESTMLRAFSARPFSLTELDSLIGGLSYPALERRLSAMRATGLVEPVPAGGDRTPYVLTRWGREAAGPLSAAARFERLHLAADTAPLKAIDVEAAFLLSTPIAALPSQTDGTCQLAAHTSGNGQRLAGVRVAVDRGKIVECVSQLEPKPRNWAVGSAVDWLDAVVRRDVGELRIGGDEELACGLVFGVHDALFPPNANANGNGNGRAPQTAMAGVGPHAGSPL
jgi:DNA-binding HxlR family transcriptional regulator